MSERKFSIGDRVDTSEWDRRIPPGGRLNGGVIVAIREFSCESGWMATVENASGSREELDQGWLKEVKHGGE